MNLYEDQFSEMHDFTNLSTPTKILIIASTTRCGSHMLGHALYETKKFGFPLEYVQQANLNEWKKRLKVDTVDQVISELKRRRSSPNGVFAIKIHYQHIERFGGFEKLMHTFPSAYFVLLSRKDVLKQAISLSIAQQTGVWISGQKPLTNNPVYDFKQINNALKSTILNNSSWRYTLAANGCNYIEMDFDEVRKNLSSSIQSIANFVGVQLEEGDIVSEQVTKEQSGTRNIEWKNKFTEEFDSSLELVKKIKPNIFRKFSRKLKLNIK